MQFFFSLDQHHHWALIRNKEKKEFLFRTGDGGIHWTATSLPFPVGRVFFADTSEGWGIAAEHRGDKVHTFCIHTSDSGLTWQRLGRIAYSPQTPTGLVFDSNQHGWVVGEGVEAGASGTAFVMETDDGGNHWTKLNWRTQPASGLYGVRFCNGQILAWSGGSGGSGIYALGSGIEPKKVFGRETMDFACLNDRSIVSVGSGAVYLLREGYTDWEETLPSSGVLRAASFFDSESGCVAGNEMYCTQDGGKTWTSRELPKGKRTHETVQIFALWMIDDGIGWAVSEDAIYEITQSARKWDRVDFFDRNGKPLESVRRD